MSIRYQLQKKTIMSVSIFKKQIKPTILKKTLRLWIYKIYNIILNVKNFNKMATFENHNESINVQNYK